MDKQDRDFFRAWNTMKIIIGSIIYLCFSNTVYFRVALDLQMNSDTAVHLTEAKAYEMKGETLVNETKIQ